MRKNRLKKNVRHWFPALADNLAIGGYFTVISLVRSYAVRRLFNRLHAWHH